MQTSPVKWSPLEPAPSSQGEPDRIPSPPPFNQTGIEAVISSANRQGAIEAYASFIEKEPESIQAIWAHFIIRILKEDFRPSSTRKLGGAMTIKTYSLTGPYGDSEDINLVYDYGSLVTVIPAKIDIKGNRLTATEYWRCYNTKVLFKNVRRSIRENNLVLKALDRGVADLFNTIKTIKFVDDLPGTTVGKYSNTRKISLENSIGYDTFIHEIFHYWDHYISNFSSKTSPLLHKDKSDVGSIFYGTSWRRSAKSWLRRTNDTDDFRGETHTHCASDDCLGGPPGFNIYRDRHPYGMENPAEDLATVGEDYVTDAVKLRSKVRRGMRWKDFELALKYLFIKHLTPLKGKEFDTSESSPPLTLSEVEERMQASGDLPRNVVDTFDNIKRIVGEHPTVPKVQEEPAEPQEPAAAEQVEEPAAAEPTVEPEPAPSAEPREDEAADHGAAAEKPDETQSEPVMWPARNWADRVPDLSASTRIDYTWGSYPNDRSTVGPAYIFAFEPTLKAFVRNLKLSIELGPAQVERRAREGDGAPGGRILKLSSEETFRLAGGINYANQDFDHVNIRINPSADSRFADLNLSIQECGANFCYESDKLKGGYLAGTVGGDAGLDIKFHPGEDFDFLIGVDAGVHFLLSSANTELEDEEIEGSPDYLIEYIGLLKEGKEEEAAALKDENESLYSWFVRPALSFVLPSSRDIGLYRPKLIVGANVEDDPVRQTDYGAWYLKGFSTFNAGALAGLESTLYMGKDRRLQVPFSLVAEIGNYFRLNAGIGIGWNFENALLQIMGTGSVYRNSNNEKDVQISSAGLMLSISPGW